MIRLSIVALGALCVLLSLTSGCATPSPLDGGIGAVIREYPDQIIAVAYRDLGTGETLQVREREVMHAASTMKVPVMIEAYRQADRGDFSLDDPLLVENRFRSIVDGSEFTLDPAEDSDAEIYEYVGGSLPIRELIRRMIVVSSNLATDVIIDLVTPESVQKTLAALGAQDMKVRRGVQDLASFEAGLNNVTTAGDLMLVMQAIALDEAASPAACQEMVAILEAQEFNEMIPAGLPPEYRVAHKTGRITAIHHDAAIVYPPTGSPYVLVVMTRGFEDSEESARVVARISAAVHAARTGAKP